MPHPILIIRSVQMAALGTPRERAFEARLTAYLGRRWPPGVAPLDDSTRVAFVTQAIHRARAIGATVERDVALFAVLCASLGQGFVDDARYPWAKAIVDAAGTSGAQKVALLSERAAEHFRWIDSAQANHQEGGTS
jgi:hypothetical protein